MCGPHRRFAPLLSHTLRRIPQAVGVVAMYQIISDASSSKKTVSIPQAVGTIAYRLCFTFSSFRYLRCANLIVALRLCYLTPFDAYRKR